MFSRQLIWDVGGGGGGGAGMIVGRPNKMDGERKRVGILNQVNRKGRMNQVRQTYAS